MILFIPVSEVVGLLQKLAVYGKTLPQLGTCGKKRKKENKIGSGEAASTFLGPERH